MKRAELVANILVGGIGAYGQGVLPAHTLDSYPFAILNSPPERFYSRTGWALALIAPLLSVLLLYVFRGTLRPFVTAIPVVACPLVFWLLFRLVFALNGYNYLSAGKGSDLIANKGIEIGFSSALISLTLEGFVAGLICGLVLWFLFTKVWSRGVT